MNTHTSNMMQHKRVLCLISLPDTPEFKKHSEDVNYFQDQMESEGASVCREISKETLSVANQYNVVIVIAHLDEATNTLLLGNTSLAIKKMVEYIPNDFAGIFDFSSCNSAQWSALIKSRCPNCKIQCALQQVGLSLRLNIYPDIINLYLNDNTIDYYEAYNSVLEVIEEGTLFSKDGCEDEETTKLGNPESIVYAPSTVSPGDPFMVQLFLIDDNTKKKQIKLKATKRDPFTGHIETDELPVALEVGDIVDVGYSIWSPSQDFFEIDNSIRTTKWNGRSVDFQFNVIVKEGIPQTSFINKIIIEVNHCPVAECSFRTSISKTENRIPTDIAVMPRDNYTDGEVERANLQKQLTETLCNLKEQLEEQGNGYSHDELLKTLNTCRLCISLMEQPFKTEVQKRPKRVFISSTCEDFMKPFRKAVRDVILSLKMEPEMCDEWPQSGCNPTHVCCQKVLDSDIYIGVLGGRYGYIEPSLEASMTQVEYMTALSARKKMLLFIINPINQTEESESNKKRQKDFIDKLKRSRILRTFSSVSDLSELTKNDLLDYIAKF